MTTAVTDWEVSPSPLIHLMTADCQAKTLSSAVELGVFTALGRGPATEPELRAALGIHPRMSRDFLDSLVSLRLLDRDGDHYRNTPLADFYLDEAKPTYIGEFMHQIEMMFYPTWQQLTSALRTGQAMVLDPDKGGFVEGEHRNHGQVRRWLSGQDALTDRIGEELARRLDWSRYHTFADLGGARGNLAAVIAAAHPHLKGICVDRSRTAPLFEQYVNELGLADRVTFQAADLLTDQPPAVDVLIYGHVLHGYDAPASAALVHAAKQSLNDGGTLVVYDRMIDDDRRSPDRLLSSLHVMLVSPEGAEYRAVDCADWLRQAGFGDVCVEPLLSSHTLVIGR